MVIGPAKTVVRRLIGDRSYAQLRDTRSKLSGYFRLVARHRRDLGWSGLASAVWDLRPWLRALADGTALGDEMPWITFGAIRAVNRVIGANTRAIEYGSGGSTLFLARRAHNLVSVEHDPAWYASVKAALSSAGLGNVELTLLEPAPDPIDLAFRSTDERYVGMSFESYARACDRFEDGYFDLALIDGRARVACFNQVHPKVRAGGSIVLDNSEREEYSAILTFCAERGWEVNHYLGPGPYSEVFWRTSIIRKSR